MPRILLDQNVPRGLRRLLPEHEVTTALRMGWDRLQNGELIAAAEHAEFDILITGDKNLQYQQSLGGRRIAVLVLSSIRWAVLQTEAAVIRAALEECGSGSFSSVNLERDPAGG